MKKNGVNEQAYQYFDNPKVHILSDEEITERAILMLLNEAVWCLEDNIIENTEDGDIGAVFGIGFLPWSAGPFSYMNLLGISKVVERLEFYESKFGPKFKPRPLLFKMLEEEEKF